METAEWFNSYDDQKNWVSFMSTWSLAEIELLYMINAPELRRVFFALDFSVITCKDTRVRLLRHRKLHAITPSLKENSLKST